jgi:Tol biopolymer transport system component/predicted Ser/Thr protein kinase
MSLSPGTRLGPYEVVSPLGAGGMGEVYRARDTRLGREVALKALPADFAADPDRRRRFEQEARAASALNHPNIVSVFDVGLEGEISYIAMELVDGVSLRDLADGGTMSPRRVLEIAAPLADGLARAHAAGIVHRDLKPENVMVSKDGFVKILDFGLAKATAAAEGSGVSQMPTMDPGTGAGAVLGTVAYMSPEQASGRTVDHRSDQFSFATILHELLSGKKPFLKPTAVETMSAIIREDVPPLSQFGISVPAPLRWILDRCHAKEPDGRYASTLDLARELKGLRDHFSELSSSVSGTSAPAAEPALGKRVGARKIAALAAAFLLGAAIVRLLWRPAAPRPPALRYLTFAGQDAMPSVSPDGGLLAFCSFRDDRPRIWLEELKNGTGTALTSGQDTEPRFSPDGSSILFTRTREGKTALYRVSVLGGEPRHVVDDAYQGDWSPDGRQIAFVRSNLSGVSGSIVVCDSDGGDERALAVFPDKILAYPRWSPDGKTVAAGLIGSYAPTLEALLLIDAATGRKETIPSATRGGTIHGLVWSSPRSVLYESTILPAAPGTASGASFLWNQPISGGPARQVFALPGSGTALDILADGSVALDQMSQSENLRAYALGGAGSLSRWITHGIATDRQPFFSPDGRWVAFSSGRNGRIDIWKIAVATGEERRLTEASGTSWDPAFTPDGSSIVFSSNRTGHFEIWKADADGSHPVPVTHQNLDCENPDVSSDGRWIYYVRFDGKGNGIWRVHVDGSGNELVLAGSGNPPELSRDGAFFASSATATEISVYPTTGARKPVFRIPPIFPGGTTGSRYRWLGASATLLFLGFDPSGHPSVFAQDARAGSPILPQPVAAFPPETAVETFDVSPDGKTLVTAEQELQANIYLLENVPGVRKTSRKRE